MHALQRPQDVHRPARRRRPRLRAPSPSATSSPRTCRRPIVVEGRRPLRLDYDRPKSIGRVRSFFGNVGILFRGYCYIRTLGPDGLQRGQRERRAQRQLPAERGSRTLTRCRTATAACTSSSPAPATCAARRRSARWTSPSGCSTTATTRRPCTSRWSCPEALMIEPTETESKETLDAFADALLKIVERGRRTFLHDGPAHAADQPARRGEGGQGADPAVDRPLTVPRTDPEVARVRPDPAAHLRPGPDPGHARRAAPRRVRPDPRRRPGPGGRGGPPGHRPAGADPLGHDRGDRPLQERL